MLGKEKYKQIKMHLKKRKVFWLTFLLILLGVLTYCFFPEKKLPKEIQVDYIVVYKSKRQMAVYSNGQVLKNYKISLGRKPVGAKEIEGDMKTPEGVYFINDKNPNSNYHKNLGISYPNTNDIEKAMRIGKPVGDNIKIHGLRNGIGFIGKFHRWFDWTLGCIAVTNKEIDELYNAVSVGTRIEIKP